jgi:hypothetical protein
MEDFSLSASYFLLLGQKKVTKQKATLLAAPSGYPALLAKPSGCASQSSPTTLGAAALLGGSQGDPEERLAK